MCTCWLCRLTYCTFKVIFNNRLIEQPRDETKYVLSLLNPKTGNIDLMILNNVIQIFTFHELNTWKYSTPSKHVSTERARWIRVLRELNISRIQLMKSEYLFYYILHL